MVENIKNCPFCGAVTYYPTYLKKKKRVTACSNDKCPIFGIYMTVKQWNRRYELSDENKQIVEKQKERILKDIEHYINSKEVPSSSSFWRCLFTDQIRTLERLERGPYEIRK